jgi:predicted outer membrane repeat protein
MKISLCCCLLLLSHFAHADIVTVGAGLSCDFSDLQNAIDTVLVNQDLENELRLVNDGSFDDKSYSVVIKQIKHIKIQGGFANCEDAEGNNITEKTVIDSGNKQNTSPTFSFVSSIIPDPVAGRPEIHMSHLVMQNSSSESGGAVYIENVWSEIDHSDFINNRAINGGALYCKSDLSFSFLIFRHTKFINNHAEGDGGALYLAGNTSANSGFGCSTYIGEQMLPTDENLFESNSAGHFGGAVFIGDYLGDTLFGQGMFQQNSALRGGVLYINSGVSSLAGYFINNSATEKGGVVFIRPTQGQTANSLFSDSYFINNSAGESAGLIYLEKNVAIHIDLSKIENNHAPTASVAESYGNLTLRNSQIINHNQSANLFYGDSANETISKLRIYSSEVRNNTNLESLINFPKGSVKIATSYLVENEVNQSLIIKGENVFNNSQNTDLFDFLTVAGNTMNNSIFHFTNNIVELKNNIFWQSGHDLFSGFNIDATYNCNLVSSHSAQINGVHNIISDPKFLGGVPFDYHVRIDSPAVDYCENGHSFAFSTNDSDGDDGQQDIQFIANEFGAVDIGADQIDASNVLFANSFEFNL